MPNSCSSHERDALFAAIAQGNTERFGQILAKLSTDRRLLLGLQTYRMGDTALHAAARHGQLGMLADLLSWIPLESTNNDGKTALHEAAASENLEVTKYLLDQGANVDALKRADWTPVMMACTKSSIEVIKTLIEKGASLNRVNKDGWTAFHLAARTNQPELLKCLLKYDPDLWRTVSKNKRTPLHTAAIHGCYQTVEFLLSLDYDVNCQDSCGSTPLADALRKGFIDTAKLLIEHGADLNTKDSLERLPVHIIAEAGEVISLDFLLSSGDQADILNCVCKGGSAPLHLAAKEGHLEMVSSLLLHGANPFTMDGKNRTALEIAQACRNWDCAQVLEDAMNTGLCARQQSVS